MALILNNYSHCNLLLIIIMKCFIPYDLPKDLWYCNEGCDLLTFLLNHLNHCDLPEDLWYCNEGCDLLTFLLNHLNHCDLLEDLWYCNEGCDLLTFLLNHLNHCDLPEDLWYCNEGCDLLTFLLNHLNQCDLPEDLWYCNEGCDLLTFLLNHLNHCDLPEDLWYCNEGCDLLTFLLNHLNHCDLPEDLWYCNEGLRISLWPSPEFSPESLHSLWPTWRSVILQWRFVYFSETFSQTFFWIDSLPVTYMKICDIAMKVCVFLCDLLPNFLLNNFTRCDLPGDLWYYNESLCISLRPSLKHSPELLHSLWPTWRSVILQWRFVYFSVTFSHTFS